MCADNCFNINRFDRVIARRKWYSFSRHSVDKCLMHMLPMDTLKVVAKLVVCVRTVHRNSMFHSLQVHGHTVDGSGPQGSQQSSASFR